MARLLLIGVCSLFVLFTGAHTLFEVLGMQFGFWAFSVFGPAVVWIVVCAFTSRTWRPAVVDEMARRERVVAVLVLSAMLRLVWPLWASPTARAWHAAHAGIGHVKINGLPSYPLGVIIGASPLAMGLVVSLVFAITMLSAPSVQRRRRRRREWPGPPADPEPLRASLLSRQRDRGGWS
jgi:hypothetical protein